jgi:flagellar biosynthesis GTPase FlhF
LPFVVAGDLAVAVREEVVRALPRFAGLPSGGAVVAVVGTGGVGKTRVAAALAVAYGGGSALAARAIAVGGAREGSSLVGLLAGRGVPVTVGEEFGGRERRGGEFVVVDTPALSPADGDGIALLGERLAVLECDGVLVAMPASVGLGAARQMLAAFAPLGVSGIVLTHVDETDQQGVAIELSIGTGVPLAYLHGGSDSRGALRSANPEHLAHELLP